MTTVNSTVENPNSKPIQPKLGMTRRTKQIIFYTLLIAIPVIQFCIFFIYVRANSIILTFQEYNVAASGKGYEITFAGLNNLKVAWDKLMDSWFMITNALLFYASSLFFGIGVALLFSYYITKQYIFSGLFKVFLFLPQILSGVVFGLIFRYLVNVVYPVLAVDPITGVKPIGLLNNPSTRLWTVLFYNVWTGFGVNILLFSGAMSGIDGSIVESASLDGCVGVREFFSIYIPLIYPTIVTLIMLGIMSLFTNQYGLYTLLETNAGGTATLGYEFYVQANGSDVIITDAQRENGKLDYGELSAMGLIVTVVVFPLVTIIKKLLEKYGPSVD